MWIFQDNRMLQHMVSKNVPPKNCVVDFGLQRLSPVNLGVIIIPGRHPSAVQSFPSKLYFCGHKTPFRTHKSNLPNAGASERLPLFRMAKEGPENLTTNVSKYEESENQVHQGKDDTGGSTTV